MNTPRPAAIEGRILTPQGFVEGRLTIEGAQLGVVEGRPVATEDVLRTSGAIVLPGFVDLHVHGGGGATRWKAATPSTRVARTHARHGTTSLLATTMTAPLPRSRPHCWPWRPPAANAPRGAARVLGVHLEGPYLNPGKLGAQPDFARTLAGRGAGAARHRAVEADDAGARDCRATSN
jgi:N-acetylglucosamine-6-phosphate deacetylase